MTLFISAEVDAVSFCSHSRIEALYNVGLRPLMQQQKQHAKQQAVSPKAIHQPIIHHLRKSPSSIK